MSNDTILLEHGDGGMLTGRLIREVFLPQLRNEFLEKLEDGAVCSVNGCRLCFSTDSYVVNPYFFPGGDIGSLAVHGTVNDIAMCAGKPLYLSAGFILEEGFPLADLEKIVHSMAEAAGNAGVHVVTGDTKVVQKGAADGIFINTAGVGAVSYHGTVSVSSIQPGDTVILNGFIGDHGAAILSKREGLGLSADIVSDSAPLNGLVADILDAGSTIRCMRDATRGGLGAVLAEIAAQSGLCITVEESAVPVREPVRAVCEILGIDPMFLANEGKMAVFCGANEADGVLNAMRGHEYGRNAAVIGTVSADRRGRCVLKTAIGGQREIGPPTGELVPRIC